MSQCSSSSSSSIKDIKRVSLMLDEEEEQEQPEELGLMGLTAPYKQSGERRPANITSTWCSLTFHWISTTRQFKSALPKYEKYFRIRESTNNNNNSRYEYLDIDIYVKHKKIKAASPCLVLTVGTERRSVPDNLRGQDGWKQTSKTQIYFGPEPLSTS